MSVLTEDILECPTPEPTVEPAESTPEPEPEEETPVESDPANNLQLPIINLDRYTRLPMSVLFDHRITAADLRVYAVLSFQARGTVAWIGVARLAHYTHLSRPTVMSSLSRLSHCGYLTVTQKTGARGRPMNIYHLTHPLHAAATTKKFTKPSKRT